MKPITNIHINSGQVGLFDYSRTYPLAEIVKINIEIRMTKKINAIVEEINQ